MKEFFSFEGGIGFKMFGPTHIITLLLFALCIVLLYNNKEKLKKFKYKDKIPYIAAVILFLNRFIFCGALKHFGIYNIKYDLPLHFCFIAAYVFILAVITKSNTITKMSYFFSIAGPLVAIIVPNTTQNMGIQLGADRYIYYQFVIAHHFLVLANLYNLWVMDLNVKGKDAIVSLAWGNIIVFFVNIYNYFAGTNYSMLKEIPKEAVDVFPFLNFGPPIMWLEIGALIMIGIAFIPVKLKKSVAENGEKLLVEKLQKS